MLGHLDQLAQLDELAGPIEFGYFRDTVRAEIRALKAGDLDGGNQGAPALRGVSVLDANALRHLRYRAVVVLGLTERSFLTAAPPGPPAARRRTREAQRLGRVDDPLRARDPTRSHCSSRSPAAARERLLTTRRAAEAGARPQLPSSFFREAASTLAGRRLDASEIVTLETGFYRFLRAGKLGPEDPPARSLHRSGTSH